MLERMVAGTKVTADASLFRVFTILYLQLLAGHGRLRKSS